MNVQSCCLLLHFCRSRCRRCLRRLSSLMSVSKSQEILDDDNDDDGDDDNNIKNDDDDNVIIIIIIIIPNIIIAITSARSIASPISLPRGN